MAHWLRIAALSGLASGALAALGAPASAQGRYQPAGPAQRAFEGAESARLEAERLGRAGDAAGAEERYRVALQGFTTAVEADREFIAAYSQAGLVAYRLGTPQAVLALLGEGRKRRADHPDLMFWHGQHLVLAGQDAEGVALLEQVAGRHPDAWPEVFLALGNHYYRNEDFRAAEPSFAEYVRRNPDAVEVRAKLGNTYFRLERFKEALAEFEAVLRRQPDDVRVLVNIGNVQVQLGRFAEAIKTLERALRLDPKRHSALFNLAHSHFKLGQYAEAVPYYARYRAVAPDDFNGHYFAGSALMALGQDAAAIEALEQAARLRPDQVHPPYKLGLIHLKAGADEAARTRLEAALALKPEDPWVISALGTLARRAGQTSAAVERHARAVRLAPQHARLHGNLALSAWQAGDLEAALAALEEGLQRDATDDWLRQLAGTLLATKAQALSRAGELPGALKLLDRAIELRPEVAVLRADRALVRLALGALKAGVTEAEAAHAADPQDGTAWLAVGRARLAQGQAAEAVEALERAFAARPDGATAAALGEARLRAGAEALVGLTEAATRWPEDPAVRAWLGAARFDRAWRGLAGGRAVRRDAADFQIALTGAGLDPKSLVRARYGAAVTALRLGDGATARRHLAGLGAAEGALSRAPAGHLALLRARAALLERKDAQAVEALEGLPLRGEAGVLARVAHLRLGEAALGRGAVAVAADHFRRADGADSDAWTQHHRAVVAALQGKLRGSVKAWRKVQGVVPEADYNLALALEETGDHAGAWQHYARYAGAGRPHSEAARRIADVKARIFGLGQETP